MPQPPPSSMRSSQRGIALAFASALVAECLSIHLWQGLLLVVELHLRRRKFVFGELELLLMREVVEVAVDAHH